MIHQTRARLTDPITSHEAAEGLDINRSQTLVLERARTMPEPFTDQQLELAFVADPPPGPRLSPQRIRSARRELHVLGLIDFTGYTAPATGRRRCLWRAVSGAQNAPSGVMGDPA
ncbi:hypothetical protein [Brachybacterium nesterenkovii]|uniref:hypothetical protein n=1 Tax=Brachybacterium nesterenkovii TaxID=47847 RepID=UPI0032193CAC